MNVDALLETLTEPQRAAVTHTDGPLLVLAGAGSGKTRVVTRRAAYLVASATARPDQVLAITFTNRAAGEMRERIFSLGAGGGPWRSGRMWICTFHALCARLLRSHGSAVGVSPNFTIYDDADRRSVIKEAIESCDLSADNWRPRAIEAHISDAKNRMLDATRFADEAGDFSAKTIARVYRVYQDFLRRRNACDFDDLLMLVATLLSDHDDVRQELSNRFRYLLVDEYQDTNHAQYLIAAQLASEHRNICVTGDPDQSIYAWRGADIQNILDFEADYPDACVVRLERNYRSTPAILSAASSLIAHNRLRKEKALWTENEPGPAVRVWQCEDERDEAARIATDIQALVAEGHRAGDVGIFYRVNAVTRVLEDALRSAQVPYQIARGVEFYNRKEIKDTLAYLKAIANPADTVATLRAINAPARGIGKVTIEHLKAYAESAGATLADAAACAELIPSLKPAARKKIAPFAALLAELRTMPPRPVGEIVEAVLSKSGLESAIRAGGDIENDALENVNELVSAARQYDEDEPDGSLAEWLQQVALVNDIDGIQLEGGLVTLMTLHASKGLEFPVVYVVGLEEDLLPHRRAVQGEASEIEEERRLCFVGMTRAMRRLTLSFAQYRMMRGVSERAAASRFLGELPQDEIEFDVIERPTDRSRAHLGRYNEDDDEGPDPSRFHPGQSVNHREYGVGCVVSVEPRGQNMYVCIHFDDFGRRSFALDHVTLDFVEC